MRNVVKPLTKSVLISLGLTAATLANEEMDYILKKVKSLEESGLLIKGGSKTIGNEGKKQQHGFLSMLLGTLHASLLGKNKLTVKGTIRSVEERIRTGQEFYSPFE